ncbi:MAG: VOC family protein [Chitinophagaceae bacterium]|nr:VOC family protein [Chitinophagaceae bacterium]
MTDSSTFIYSTVPVIATHNIEKSLSYYSEILGFSVDFKYGDPLTYAGVKSGNAEIYFTLDPDMAQLFQKEECNPEIFIWVVDAGHLFNIHAANGAEIIEPVSDRPWGARQYVVREINGYHLKFAQAL